MDPAAMQAKIGELEASLLTVTGALQQLSTQQAVAQMLHGCYGLGP